METVRRGGVAVRPRRGAREGLYGLCFSTGGEACGLRPVKKNFVGLEHSRIFAFANRQKGLPRNVQFFLLFRLRELRQLTKLN